MIKELRYSNTNTYLICGSRGKLLFDTGWAGTFDAFCHALGEADERMQDIDHILISHYHPDHMGIAQQIADRGARLVIMDVQKDFTHVSDGIFAKENRSGFVPVKDSEARMVNVEGSRGFLAELGFDGEVIHTPGHSDDSISLMLDTGEVFVGDLNPLYELEMHRGTEIENSWNRLLERKPVRIYYGHAKTAVLSENDGSGAKTAVLSENDGSGAKTAGFTGNDGSGAKTAALTGNDVSDTKTALTVDHEIYASVNRIIKYVKKGYSPEKIQKKTGLQKTFTEDVIRMYLTHPGVSVQGILDRIEIKGK